MSVALETSALTKRYRSVVALDKCDLTIPTGRVVGLVGPNGAGKTTLLNLAVGLLAPTSRPNETRGSRLPWASRRFFLACDWASRRSNGSPSPSRSPWC